jgi:hypothetical protein
MHWPRGTQGLNADRRDRRSPLAEGCGHLLASGFRLVAGPGTGVARAAACAAVPVLAVEPPLVHATGGLAFGGHRVPFRGPHRERAAGG